MAEGHEKNAVAEDEKAEAGLSPSVEVEDLEACRKRLKIEVPAEGVKSEYEDALKELGRTVHVDGFRRGHVPRVRLLKQFGETLAADVKAKLVAKAMEEAFESTGIEPVSEPELGPVDGGEPEPGEEAPKAEGEEGSAPASDLDAARTSLEKIEFDLEKPLSFQLTVEVKPAFDLPEYKGLKLTRKRPEVTDERVESVIGYMRRDEADYVPVTSGGAKPGDRLTATARLEVEGEKIWEAEEEVCHLVEDRLLGLAAFPDRKDVEGIAPAEERELDVTVPDGFKEEEHRGKEAKLFLRADEVKRPELPPLDEEAAKRLGMLNVQMLRDRVRQRLEATAEAEAREGLERQIVEQLTGAASFELPPGMLSRDADYRAAREMLRLGQMGIPLDALEESHREKIRTSAREASERGLRARLIFDGIAKAEGIEATDDDLEEEIYNYAEATRRTPVAVRSELERAGRLDAVRDELMAAKVVNFLVEQADITDAPEGTAP